MRRMDLAAAAVAVLILGSAAVATRHEAQDDRRVAMCANNLKQLWMMQNNYMMQFGGSQRLMPKETGDAFWLKLSEVGLIDESLLDIYQCPVEHVADDGCDYRGPAKDVNAYLDEDPVGADVDGNHGEGRGGNVLLKSGDIRTVASSDALWAKAAGKTTGGNKAIPPKSIPPKDETPKQRRAVVQMGHLAIAVLLYREFYGEMPKDLQALIEAPKDAKGWPEGGFLLEGKLPKDPWGNEYNYEPGMREPKIWTWGADGKKGGDGENADLSLDDVGKKGRSDSALSANERNASLTLKTLATAQADFRSNDRDCNMVQDFWTGDVAGLYAIDNTSTGAANPSPIKLIEVDAAKADMSPRTGNALKNGNYSKPISDLGYPSAKSGYWFCALSEDKQVTANGGNGAYAQDTDGTGDAVHNTSRFGICAVPARYGETGRRVFIVNESATIFWRDFGKDLLKYVDMGPPLSSGVFDFNWPTDAELARDWHKME